MSTEAVLYHDLTGRIKQMRQAVDAAESCLVSDRDYLQCAVRLQDAAAIATFDQLLLLVMDSISEVDK